MNKFKKGFKPHLSIGQLMGKNKLYEVINDLQKNWNNIEFLLNHIYFISRGDNKTSKFEIIKQISLQE